MPATDLGQRVMVSSVLPSLGQLAFSLFAQQPRPARSSHSGNRRAMDSEVGHGAFLWDDGGRMNGGMSRSRSRSPRQSEPVDSATPHTVVLPLEESSSGGRATAFASTRSSVSSHGVAVGGLVGRWAAREQAIARCAETMPTSAAVHAALVPRQEAPVAFGVDDSFEQCCLRIDRVIARGWRFYIGISENPERRFEEHLGSRCGWSMMEVLVQAWDSRTTAELERRLIGRYHHELLCQNVGRGGERASASSPHYLYVLMAADSRLRRNHL